MDTLMLTVISKRDLRNFGLIMGLMIAVFFGVILPWIWGGQYWAWPWWAGGVLAGFGLTWPMALKWMYVAWMKIGGILGRINTTLILGLAYLLIFVPLGLILRVFGKDTLEKRWPENVKTYRRIRLSRAATHMERQF